MSEKVKLVLSVSAAGLLLILLAVAVWYNSPIQATKRACQGAVKEHLRSPSTAVFGPAEYEDTMLSDPSAEVRGWVDAANAYGTPIRNYYLCLIESEQNIEVHLSEAKFDSYHERLRQGRGPF